MTDETRRALEASEPKRDQYDSDETFLEARSRWLETAGRILSLTGQSRRGYDKPRTKSGPSPEELALIGSVMRKFMADPQSSTKERATISTNPSRRREDRSGFWTPEAKGSAGPIHIDSKDFWVKVVGMLQQNWALVSTSTTEKSVILFINDLSEIFDEVRCSCAEEAVVALSRNGFERFNEGQDLKRSLSPPTAPYVRGTHPNGPIYSSGRFWH